MPDDEATQAALQQIAGEGLATVINIVNEQPQEAAQEAVALIRQGEADVLMKGLIGTDQLLRAVLNKDTGILPPGHVLTHLAAAETSVYHKLLFFTDAAVIPYPTHEQRIEQVRYTVGVCHGLGIEEPRIALTHCAEHGGKQFPFVDGYADIIQMARDGAFGRCLVDGPMDIKTACSLHALETKHMTSPLEGEADVLIMPDIEAGNTLYKALTFFAGAKAAGMLCGAKCPVVLPSRGDDAETKYDSILMALASLS
jgi:phosphate butyryltransferase